MYNLPKISDVCKEISNYLPLIDVLMLIKYDIFRFKFNISNNIKERLTEIGMSTELCNNFIKSLDKTHTVLSGSFMVACLTAVINKPLNWIPSDLDIYCHPDGKNSCSICNVGCFKIKSIFSEFLCSNEFSGVDGVSYPILSIEKNRKWENDNHKFEEIIFNEIIIEKDVNIKDFIFDTFDFDICKITYDGNTLFVYDPISLIKKKCTYKGDYEALKYFDSEMDDEYHGVEYYSGNSDYEFRMNRLYKTYTIRKEKYCKYGFEIHCDFDFGDRFNKDRYTEDKICNFIKEMNILFNDNILRVTYDNYNNATKINICIKKNAVKYFIGTLVNIWNKHCIDHSTRLLNVTNMDINLLINKHFYNSKCWINAHPSSMSLNVVLAEV